MNKTIPLALLGSLLLTGPVQALLQAEPSRVDFGSFQPGDVIEHVVTIHNRGDSATELSLDAIRFHDEDVTVSPERLRLEPGQSEEVLVTIRLASDEAGGRHDVRLTATEVDVDVDAGDDVTARSAVRIPIIFNVDNLKVASLRMDDAPANLPGKATAMVFNHLPQATNATLHLLLRDHAGNEMHRLHSDPVRIRAGEHAFIPLSIAGRAPRAYTVEAWAEHESGRSNRMEKPFRVGDKEATIGVARVEPLGDGRYRLEADLSNAGGIDFVVETIFHVTGPDGSIQEIAGHSFNLPPGELVTTSAVARLAPGTHHVVPTARWDGGSTSVQATTFEVPEQDHVATGSGGLDPTWFYAAGGLAVGVGAMLTLQRKRMA